MKIFLLGLIFSLIFLANGVFAETVSDSEVTDDAVRAEALTLEQARVLALANSRNLAKYNLSIRSSVLDERNHFYTMIPSLSAEYNASMSYLRDWVFVNPVDTFNTGLTFAITQKIFEGGKSFIQKAITEISTESVRNEALAEYFNVLDALDNAYYAVLEAEANLTAAESSLQTAVLSLAIAEIRYEGGIINQGDYLRALANKEAQENSRNQARRNLTMNATRFNSLTGFAQTPALAHIDFDKYEALILHLAGISDDEADALYTKLLGILAQTNPSIARASLNTQRAERNLSLARREYVPTISATIFSTGLNYSTADGFRSQSNGGVSIRGRIPVDFWVMANRVERSRLARDSAMLDQISAGVSLELELQSALINAIAQAESVLSSRRTLEYTERHFEYVMERYRLSHSSVSDVGEASSLFITSKNNLNRASYGFLQSISRLRSLWAVDDEQRLIKTLLEDL